MRKFRVPNRHGDNIAHVEIKAKGWWELYVKLPDGVASVLAQGGDARIVASVTPGTLMAFVIDEDGATAEVVIDGDTYSLSRFGKPPTMVSARSTNGQIVADMAGLHLSPEVRANGLVLDPTPGDKEGMWTLWRPKNLILSRRDFMQPFPVGWSGAFDLVIADPPFVAQGSKPKNRDAIEHNDRYGRDENLSGTKRDTKAVLEPDDIRWLMLGVMAHSVDVLKKGGQLWVKSADYVWSGKVVWGNHEVRTLGRELGLVQLDETILSSSGMQPFLGPDGMPRNVDHVRHRGSLMTLWRKVR